eukprot:1161584-Pelagomonas_calceolata.AAC.2
MTKLGAPSAGVQWSAALGPCQPQTIGTLPRSADFFARRRAVSAAARSSQLQAGLPQLCPQANTTPSTATATA